MARWPGHSTVLAQRSGRHPQPELSPLPGTMQSQLGCPGDWNYRLWGILTCDPEDDLWLGTFDLTADNYEYKAALNKGWADNYGLHAEYYDPNIARRSLRMARLPSGTTTKPAGSATTSTACLPTSPVIFRMRLAAPVTGYRTVYCHC
ncbi:MAG: hypothetical protein R3C44_24220 [Chloroflexota bacterium]